MRWTRDDRLPNPLEKLGMGLGFFRRYADSFWQATGMELDLVYADGEPWESVASRVRGDFCRNVALDPGKAELCRNCFRNACQLARGKDGFHTVDCHAGQRFSVRPIGEIGGAGVLLLTGRVTAGARRKTAEDSAGKQTVPQSIKTQEAYRGALDLIGITLPYLRIRLDVDLLLAAREFPPMVRKACQYVDDHFQENISVAGVALACGVSEDYLSHTFSKCTGNPLSRYIAAVRIGHAMYLLQDEKPGIAEIAFEVGFGSLSQFNRTFRALRGMAPGEFRRQEREGSGK
ncbi:helix-turn-helix domain-containing protein [Akkermansiaceae bacterium]|nr:helix-turn-helix domain-containing protein [Akkermansiaceae bacterium]